MSGRDQNQKYCPFYIKELTDLPNQQEIMTRIMSQNMEEKIKALKKLIICILHDQNYPRMIMNVLQACVPTQQQNHELKKTVVFYWEIVDKMKDDGVSLKDEMIMVVNSLRSDVLHANEYIRGRTMRLLSRIQYKGILESLIPSVIDNLKHSHYFVRRNALQCLYKIYLNFGNEMLNDLADNIINFLKTEQDIGSIRLAFTLLFHTDRNQAYLYLEQHVLNQDDSINDQLQLTILQLFRFNQQKENNNINKLIKIILHFIKNNKSSGLQLECANSLVECSNAFKMAQNIYIQLLGENSENNVKLFILNKVLTIKNVNNIGLQEQVLDIAQALNTKSNEIRQKTLDIIKQLSSKKNIKSVYELLIKEISECDRSKEGIEQEYKEYLLENLLYYIEKYSELVEEISIRNLIEKQLQMNNLNIVKVIKFLLINHSNLRPVLITLIISNIQLVNQSKLAQNLFLILGEFQHNHIQSLETLIKIMHPLPLSQQQQPQQQQQQQQQQSNKNKVYKTVILQDGSYGTELVGNNQININSNNNTLDLNNIRQIVIDDTYLASIYVNTLIRILFNLQDHQNYNTQKNQVLQLLCAIARHNQFKIDGNLTEKIKIAFQYLTQPHLFTNLNWLKQKDTLPLKLQNNKNNQHQSTQSQTKIIKQCQDLIQFRQLKNKNGFNNQDDEVNDIQINEQFQQKNKDNNNYTKRLSKIVQLTGYSDPVYAEAFVDFQKYDINFEILLINRTNQMLQNLQIEFISQGEMRTVEKQCINLQKQQTQMIKQQMKLSSSEISTIYGSISWDNKSGMESQCLITNEIQIDLTEFIYPHSIDLEQFRVLWQKYQWENRIIVNTNITQIDQFLNQIQSSLNLQLISNYDNQSEYVSVNMYAKTTLEEDFLVNISLEKIQNKIQGYIRIRSQSKGLILNLGDNLKQIQNI